MRSAILSASRCCDVVNSNLPEVFDDEILVKVNFSGICGSDIAVYHGTHPYKKPPVVLGHEFSGIVVDKGRSVKNVNEGDLITAMSYSPCEKCPLCYGGLQNLCENKKSLSHDDMPGSFSEYIKIKANMAIKLNNVDPRVAALVEPLSIGHHSISTLSNKNAENIVIIGAGAIGLSTLIAAKCSRIKKIAMVDVEDNKEKICQHFGASCFFNSKKYDLKKSIDDNFPDGVDCVIISYSYKGCIDDAIDMVKPGGTVLIVAYFTEYQSVNFNKAIIKGISIQTAFLGNKKDFESVVSWIESKKIDPEKLITHEFPLNHIANAFLFIENNKGVCGKVLINMGN
ncbi:MAG: zinc-dependent alcohol dehydrogenase [Cellvibrionaceae bacterium]